MPSPLIRIGTRGSPLALYQAHAVRDALAAAHGLEAAAVAIEVFTTTGDRTAERQTPLPAGAKGLFTKEIDEALLAGAVDLGVHSAKDLPTVLPTGIAEPHYLPREDVRDVLVSRFAGGLAGLPRGARFGSSSPRRRALMLRARPDLAVGEFRGNVGTRLAKVADGRVDATILALAGLKRLGLLASEHTPLDVGAFPPAAGQGAIAMVGRSGDARVAALLEAVADAATGAALACERAFLAVLDGSCRTPIAGHAEVSGTELVFRGLIVRPDGTEAHDLRRTGAAADAARIGRDAGSLLRARGGPAFFAD